MSSVLARRHLLKLLDAKKVLLVMLFVGSLAAAYRMIPAREIYFLAKMAYSSTGEYRYTFQNEKREELRKSFSNGRIVIALPCAHQQGVLLVSGVKSTFFGKLFWPEILIKGAGFSRKEVIEPDAQGDRYIPLGSLGTACGKDIALTAKRADITTSKLYLLRFPDINVYTESVVILSPHPDDAEIASFGLYSDTKPIIVTVTNGEGGQEGYFAALPKREEAVYERARLRVIDSITVPLIGGVAPDQCINLGYFDGTLIGMFEKKTVKSLAGSESGKDFRQLNVNRLLDSASTNRWEHLVADLKRILEHYHPSIVVAPHPLLDTHADHRLTTIALMEALEQMPDYQGKLLLYSNHPVYSEMFPFGWTDGIVGLHPWHDRKTFFESVYSHELSPLQQQRKLVALEAMHDLRSFDFRSVLDDNLPLDWRKVENIFGVSLDYYRRAVRPNELFYVYTVSSALRFWRDQWLQPITQSVSFDDIEAHRALSKTRDR